MKKKTKIFFLSVKLVFQYKNKSSERYYDVLKPQFQNISKSIKFFEKKFSGKKLHFYIKKTFFNILDRKKKTKNFPPICLGFQYKNKSLEQDYGLFKA